LVDPTMRPVAVVVVEVLDEQLAELAFVPDQGAVEQFGSGGADEALGGCVGAWRSGWGVDDVELVRREDLVERGDEHGGVVSNQEPEPIDVEVHGEVAGGLGAPGAGEMSGDPGEVHVAGGVFDEEQDVELAEPDGVDDEGVTRDDPAACAVRNWVQVGPVRLGAGSMPWRFRMAQTVEGARRWPSPASSPWMRR